MERVYKNINKKVLRKWIGIIFVAFSITWVLVDIWPVYLTTHDDFSAFINYYCDGGGFHTLLGQWKATLSYAIGFSRPWIVVTFPFQYARILYSSGNIIVYKVVAYGALMFQTFCLYKMVEKWFDEHSAKLVIGLFFAMVVLDIQHNLLVSYPVLYHIAFAMICLSFCFWKEEKYSNRYALSAICFFIGCVLYENMVVFALPFLILTLLSELNSNKINFDILWEYIKKIRWHVIVGCIFILVTCIWIHFYPSQYNGNVIDVSSLEDIAYTVWKYGVSRSPIISLGECLFGQYKIGLNQFRVSSWIKAIISAIIVTWLLKMVQYKQYNNKKIVVGIVVAEISAFLSILLISLTPKYIAWAKGSTTAYLPSYYSYVFHIVALVFLFLLIINNLNGMLKNVLCCSFGVLVFIVSLGVEQNNLSVIQNVFIPQENRWECFVKMFSDSEVLNDLDDEVVIYPVYHENVSNTFLDEMSMFASHISRKNILFVDRDEKNKYENGACEKISVN